MGNKTNAEYLESILKKFEAANYDVDHTNMPAF